MRNRTALLALSVALIPSMVFALDFREGAKQYEDFSSLSLAERAGVSLLTDVGAVGGYPDGTYRPRRALNRAEFLKIVLLSHPDAAAGVEATIPWNCFRDVPTGEWFNPSVCYAKDQGIVEGYPDGTFKPEQSVNYAEAVKMLVELYGYERPKSNAAWYTPYIDAAVMHDVALPGDVEPGHFLTRGEMARLAAAFRAESDGVLDAYRDAEAGKRDEGSSSSASSASSKSSSLSSAASSSVSSVPSAALPDFPVVSRFLLLGSKTPPLLQGTYVDNDEDIQVRIPQLTLRREIKSIDKLYLIDDKGTDVMTLTLATSNNTDKRVWRAETNTGGLVLPKGKVTLLGLRADMKPRGQGASNELWEIEDFLISFVGVTSGATRQLQPTSPSEPMHITAQARVVGVKNAMEETGTMPWGAKKLIGKFTFSGALLPDASLTLEGLLFKILGNNVKLENIRIGDGSEVNSAECSMDPSQPDIISCETIPPSLSDLSAARTISVYATVSLKSGATAGSLQLMLDDPGTIGRLGAIRWTDGTGHFSWIDLPSPLAAGTRWTVKQ